MGAAVRHAGCQFVDLEGESHEVIFRNLISKPTFVNTSAGTASEGVCFYEIRDGTKYFREVTVDAATTILAPYDLWEQECTHSILRRRYMS